MTLTKEETAFLFLCLISFLAAVCYLLWGCLVSAPKNERLCRDKQGAFYDGRGTYVIRFFVMALCPVLGPCFLLMGWLMYRILFRKSPDLTDVIFKKSRVRQFLKDDEEREQNMAPIEETILLGEKKNERSLIMNVIQQNMNGSLSSLLLALNSEDPETSHYAASALQEFFNNFHTVLKKLSAEIEKEPEDEYKYEEMLIDHMRGPLKQNVFSGVEQKKYAGILEKTGERLYQKAPDRLSCERYEDIILVTLRQGDFEKAAAWCGRLAEQYPCELCAYKCRARLYYETGDKDRLFELLEELGRQDITLDAETTEFIRVFEC